MLWSCFCLGGVTVRACSRLVFPLLIWCEKCSITTKTFYPSSFFFSEVRALTAVIKKVCHILCLEATIPEGSDTHKQAHTLSDLCSMMWLNLKFHTHPSVADYFSFFNSALHASIYTFQQNIKRHETDFMTNQWNKKSCNWCVVSKSTTELCQYNQAVIGTVLFKRFDTKMLLIDSPKTFSCSFNHK